MAVAYNHIADNRRRTWALVLLFPLSFSLLFYVCIVLFNRLALPAEGGTSWKDVIRASNELALHSIPIIMLAAFVWILISYFGGDSILLGNAHAREISKDDAPLLYRLVENLCITKGLPMPRLYKMADQSLNAFATGRKPGASSIAVTDGLLKRLDKQELEAVLAHELGHIENRDITLMLIAIAGASFFALTGEFLLRVAARSSYSSTKRGQTVIPIMLLGLIFMIFGYFIAPLLRLAMSRQREYLADATAALTTRNPGALARALEKISQDSHIEVLDEHPSMAAMCIDSPRQVESSLFNRLAGLYSTHPPIEERIMRLREMDRETFGSEY